MSGRISRIAIAGLILWLLWGAKAFWPATRNLPAGAVLVSSLEDLLPLPPGQNVVIEGKVFPAVATPTESLWKERFAYRLAIWRKDEFGAQVEVVRRQTRPAIRFQWSGGSVVWPADSYRIESAPSAPGESLLYTNEHNVGFRPSEAALALGQKKEGVAFSVDEFAIAPLEDYVKALQRKNDFRFWVGHGLRVLVSFLALVILVTALKRAEPIRKEPSTPSS